MTKSPRASKAASSKPAAKPARRKPAHLVNASPSAKASAKASSATALARAETEALLAAIRRSHALIELSADGRVRDANEAATAAYGYAAGELVGQPHALLLPEELRDAAETRELWAKLAAGETVSGRWKRVAKNGDERWIHGSLTPVLDTAGKLLRVVELSTDATGEAKADEEIRRELEVRTKIMNETSIVSMADKKGDILSYNQKYLDISKYSPEELKGAPHSITRHPDMPKAVFKQMWNTIGHGQIFRGVIKNLAKDGTPYYVDAVVCPFIGKNGKPEKYLGVRYDITAAEIERQNMKGIVDALNKSQAVIEFDLKGNITQANDLFLRALGYTMDEIKGQHHGLFVDPVYRSSPEYRAFWDKLGRGEYDAGQYKRVAKGGRELWIQASYNPICDEMGRPFKVVKYASDITDQVRAQQALQAAVEQTQEVVGAAKEGDLMQRIPLDGKNGSIRDLCEGVNALVETMAGVVTQIKSASGAIGTAAKEIASGNADLSARTEQQAASLEETASSMEELTSTVKQNAENARQANQLAVGASDVAVKGGEVVSQVVTTMSAIHDSSKKIVDIISVIDGIAFQTNILALNAAVEAARAGEQGRGFAVVAAEVRSLAQRSAAAAKEIKGLIGDSVEKVGNGTKLVEQAGRTMDEVVTSVKRVTDIMAEISAASQEQSQGIEQVNQAIAQMDEVTQQNAALVEEASAAARSLEEQTEGLNDSVARFQVEEAPQAVRQAPPVAARPVTAAKPAHKPMLRAASRPAAAPAPAARRASPAKASGGDDQWSEF